MLFFLTAKPVFASSVVLNEIHPHPASGNDWIEIYNPTSTDIDLTNWIIEDSTSTIKTLSGNINPNSFVYIEVSNRLNNSGDSVILKNALGATIDSHIYASDPGIDISLGRNPDGGSWTTLSNSSQNSSNNNSQGITPTPTATSTPSPTPSPSPQNIFQLSNTPTSINSDQSFTISVQLKNPSLISQKFYIKGAFKKSDSTNYFGLTKSSNKWVKNGESYNEQLYIETNASGEWNGNIEIMPDVTDSGYTQSDTYTFKVAYYKSDGTGPTWSNQVNININHINNQPSPTPSTSPTPSPSPTSEEDLEDLAYDGIATDSYEIDDDLYAENYTNASASAEVEGVSFNNSSTTKKSNGFSMTPILFIFGFIFIGAAIFYYLRIRKNQLQS